MSRYRRQLVAKRARMEGIEIRDVDEADDFIIKAVVLESLPIIQNLVPPLNGIQQLLLQNATNAASCWSSYEIRHLPQ